jgi:uncharacterized protein (DUF736 family)
MSRKIGALWMKQTKDGKKYLSGVLQDLSGDIRIAVFPNDRKQKDNEPDYQILLSEQKKEQQRKPDGFMGVDLPSEQQPTDQDLQGRDSDVNVDDIPF